jgi:hypothetical protein
MCAHQGMLSGMAAGVDRLQGSARPVRRRLLECHVRYALGIDLGPMGTVDAPLSKPCDPASPVVKMQKTGTLIRRSQPARIDRNGPWMLVASKFPVTREAGADLPCRRADAR